MVTSDQSVHCNHYSTLIQWMKLFETFCEFRDFIFRYRAANENAELEENKIRVTFDRDNQWKHIRVSLGIILRLFYQQGKEIIIFDGFYLFCEFREIDLAVVNPSQLYANDLTFSPAETIHELAKYRIKTSQHFNDKLRACRNSK